MKDKLQALDADLKTEADAYNAIQKGERRRQYAAAMLGIPLQQLHLLGFMSSSGPTLPCFKMQTSTKLAMHAASSRSSCRKTRWCCRQALAPKAATAQNRTLHLSASAWDHRSAISDSCC